jgi:hypothetical protein
MAKRSQLAVGQEWAYSNKRQHEYTAWGSHYKATIVAVEPYEQGFSGQKFQRPKGNGVLVEVEGYNGKVQKVLQLSQLWIPWAEYEVGNAEYQVQHKINQEKEKVAKAKREKFQQEVYLPALREFVKVLEPYAPNKYISGWTRIEELPVEVLQAVTKAIQEKAVA